MRYDSSVEECCFVGFRASRKVLKALSVLARSKKKNIYIYCQLNMKVMEATITPKLLPSSMDDLQSSIYCQFHYHFLHQITFKRADRAILRRWDYSSNFSTALQWMAEEVIPDLFYHLLLLFWRPGLQTAQSCGRCFYSSPGCCLEVIKGILFFRSIPYFSRTCDLRSSCWKIPD